MFLYNLTHFSYLRLNFKLKIDPKVFTCKNLEKIKKPGKIYEKTCGNSANIKMNFRAKFVH